MSFPTASFLTDFEVWKAEGRKEKVAALLTQ